jgi:hypothetical protein
VGSYYYPCEDTETNVQGLALRGASGLVGAILSNIVSGNATFGQRKADTSRGYSPTASGAIYLPCLPPAGRGADDEAKASVCWRRASLLDRSIRDDDLLDPIWVGRGARVIAGRAIGGRVLICLTATSLPWWGLHFPSPILSGRPAQQRAPPYQAFPAGRPQAVTQDWATPRVRGLLLTPEKRPH